MLSEKKRQAPKRFNTISSQFYKYTQRLSVCECVDMYRKRLEKKPKMLTDYLWW